MTITVASGKGGTGKTTVAVNLSYTLCHSTDSHPSGEAQRVNLLDCDVEEPNVHLFFDAKVTADFPIEVPKPEINHSICVSCGACIRACKFNALAMVNDRIMVFPELCHSCGVCSEVCPTHAMDERPSAIGRISISADNSPALIQGMLAIGQTATPAVINTVKDFASPNSINIIDAPPGTGCGAVQAIRGSDVVILVTEPTPFGLHDLALAAQLTGELSVPSVIVVNRSDGKDLLIEEFAGEHGIPVVARIPNRRAFAEVCSRGDLLVEAFPSLKATFASIFSGLADAAMYNTHTIAAECSYSSFAAGKPHGHQGKEISIVSGKGGTGKTSIAACFCQLASAEGIVMVDSDVDASNLHIICPPHYTETMLYKGMQKARIESDLCTGCGVCAQQCRFNAIVLSREGNDMTSEIYEVNPLDCEGCGRCAIACPHAAITFADHIAGKLHVSNTAFGPMIHAHLEVAEDNTGKLVSAVRSLGQSHSIMLQTDLIIGDGPPGIGCPATSAISGVDLVIVVTESTVSGAHDLERVLALIDSFSIPAAIIVNKADLNPNQTQRIREIAEKRNVDIVGYLPFDQTIINAINERKTILEYSDSPAAQAIKEAWKRIQQMFWQRI